MSELYKDIKGYEGIYQVSNAGSVKSFKRGKERILKASVASNGYLIVSLYNGKPKIIKVHQLVAMAFLNHVPCGYKLVVDHRDFDRTNNHVDNLRIVTQRRNSNRKHLKSSSKYTGVHWRKNLKKWHVQIVIKGRNKYLGIFSNELEASKAYQRALSQIQL